MFVIEEEELSVEQAAAASSTPTVAVLVPCYNEALTIAKVVDDFRRVLPEATVYVYDNNSSDDTAAIARAHGAVVRLSLIHI